MTELHEGIVIRLTAGSCLVQTDACLVQCSLRGNLKKEFTFAANAAGPRRVLRTKLQAYVDTVTVGDRVRFRDTHRDAGVIEEVLPRRSRFVRRGFRGREQTIVCNLELVVVVFAATEPHLDPWKLDRFLVAAEGEGLDAVIVANKVDLTDGLIPEAYGEFLNAGYRVIGSSAHRTVGIEEIREALRGRVSAVVGPSGVGKSSLLNAIHPGLNLRTSDIGLVTHKGRHTTTAAQLIPLESGGWVADTPGLRQMFLLPRPVDEIAGSFPEFAPYLGRCEYSNCRHLAEIDCAIKLAAQSGAISPRRYEGYRILYTENADQK